MEGAEGRIKEWVKGAEGGIKEWVKGAEGRIKEWVKGAEGGIKEWVEGVEGGIKEWVERAEGGIKEWVERAEGGIKEWVEKVKGEQGERAEQKGAGIKEWAEGGWGREEREGGGKATRSKNDSHKQNPVRSKLMTCHGRMTYRTPSGRTVNNTAHMTTMNRNRHRTPSNGGSDWCGAGNSPCFRKCSYASSCTCTHAISHDSQPVGSYLVLEQLITESVEFLVCSWELFNWNSSTAKKTTKKTTPSCVKR